MRTFIRWFFSFFGYNVFFVKREERNAVDVNTKQNSAKSWANEFFHKGFEKKSYMELYNSICKQLEKCEIQINNKYIGDVGCGSGILLSYISEKFKPNQIIGFDFANSAIELAKQRKLKNTMFLVHDIYQPFVMDNKCDVIFCTEVLEHLEYPDIALMNILDMLSNSGVVFITVPNGRLDFWDGHVNFWSLSSWNVFIKRIIFERKKENWQYKVGFLSEKKNVLYAMIKK